MNHRVKREEDNYNNDRVVMLDDDDRMVTMGNNDRMVTMDDDTNGRMVTKDDGHGDGRMVTMEAEEGMRSVNALPRDIYFRGWKQVSTSCVTHPLFYNL